MTGREITQMAFDLKEPPRTPVTLIGGGSWIVDQAGKTFAGIKEDPQQIADVFIQAFRKIGHDLLWTGSNFINYPMNFLGCPIEDGTSDGPMLKGTVIQSLKDAGSLDIAGVLENPTMKGIIHSQHLVADAVGKETLAMPTQWAPFSCAARLFGVEPLMDAVFDDPDGLLELVRISTDLIWSIIEPIMEHEDILGANLSDPVASGDLISPETFRTFVKPFLKDIVGRIQGKGKYAMVHICGDTTAILEDIADIRPDCFSLEAKVDLQTAKRVLGGKVCVAGNVTPTGAFLSGSPDEVIAEARACVEAWGGGGGYVLSLGCDFPKAVPVENAMALMSLKQG
ncbi:MAG: uroporphyrinogen decarboxylase family protein [Deltaproteobacteria bacterium]|nr:uroporphyrinogen decarboxylase family protein [Deltaproteobacteria bacterium]MBW1815550.1 uroporphyrinogen decarboxylase family protein [Deltaproteobacteria bacterium]